MRRSLFISLFSVLPLVLQSAAQEIGEGRLLINEPDYAVSCEPATIEWIWTGSAEDAMTNSVSIAVLPVDGYSRRHLVKRHSSLRANYQNAASQLDRRQDVAINIAGGSDVPMSNQVWTWNSVGIAPGQYRMALSVVGTSYTAFSAPFDVVTGPDMSCLGRTGTALASSSTTTVPRPSSTSAIESSVDWSTVTGKQNASAQTASSAAQTSSASTGTVSSPISAGQEQDGTHSESNGGKVAAAVIIPLLVVGAIIIYFCLRKRKQSDRSHNQPWAAGISGFFQSKSRGQNWHSRSISNPANPIHQGGLTQHQKEIRSEMQEARPGASTTLPSTPASPQHAWVDFAGETDACPLSPGRMDEIVRVSMERSPQHAGGLYQQGANHALQEESVADSLDRSVSFSSAASTLPAYLREFASPAPSFGHDADGNALNAHRLSQTSTTTHQLARNGSLASVATTASDETATGRTNGTGARDLTRNASTHSLRRKPVPRISAVSPEGTAVAIASDEHGPFADASAVQDDGQHLMSLPPPATIQHLSMQSGVTIEDQQLQEILDGESEAGLSTPKLPRHSAFVDAPESVAPSPMNATGVDAREGVSSPLVSSMMITNLSGTDRSQGEPAGLGSPFQDGSSQRDESAWKLSVRLNDQDRGFRVSFPADGNDTRSRTDAAESDSPSKAT